MFGEEPKNVTREFFKAKFKNRMNYYCPPLEGGAKEYSRNTKYAKILALHENLQIKHYFFGNTLVLGYPNTDLIMYHIHYMKHRYQDR